MRYGRKLAFVLGGGGARGALQAGALRAVLEHGIHPDMLVGTSAGAANAAFLGLDPTLAQTIRLEQVWRALARIDFFPARWTAVLTRALLNQAGVKPHPSLDEFFLRYLPNPEFRFRQMQVPVYLIAADLNDGTAVTYGDDPEQPVLEGMLASTALPPWIRPLERGDRLLMDGGIVSNLPIEPAIAHGATEITAFDISTAAGTYSKAQGLAPFASKLLYAVARRQIDLELRLAAARNVPVHRLELYAAPPIMFWDFTRADELIAQGYQITLRFLEKEWPTHLRSRVDRLRAWWRASKRVLGWPTASRTPGLRRG